MESLGGYQVLRRRVVYRRTAVCDTTIPQADRAISASTLQPVLPAAKAPGCKTTPGEPGLKNKSRFQPALFSSRGVYASARSSETSEFGAWAIALPNLIKNQANLTPRTQRSKGAEGFFPRRRVRMTMVQSIPGPNKSLRLWLLCTLALRFFYDWGWRLKGGGDGGK